MNLSVRIFNSLKIGSIFARTHSLPPARVSAVPFVGKSVSLSELRRSSLSFIPLASGQRQIGRIPSKMESNPEERPENREIEDSTYGFVTIENPAGETPVEVERSMDESWSFEAGNGGESGAGEAILAPTAAAEVGSEEVEERGRSLVEEASELEFQDAERRVLPEELSKNVVALSCESSNGGTCDVYIVGTAHVSQESCREVQAVIDYLRPEVVFLELCSSRVAILTLRDLKIPTMREMIDMWKKKQNLFGILYSWFLAKVSEQLEVLPGSEFRVAYEQAKEIGSKVILGDRPVQITLRRTWGKMSLWHKTKLIYSFLFQALFLPSPEDINKMLKEMDDSDMLTLVIKEVSKEFPTMMETLVDERDQYMSSSLLRVARCHNSVVAVVGKGHLRGINKYWMQPVEMDKLLESPSASSAVSAAKILTSVGSVVAGVAILTGIYVAVKKNY